MRGLIYIPIVHSQVDLGTLADELRRRLHAAFGADEWTRRYASVEAMWEGISAKLSELSLDWKRVRLYQDGLPVCGREGAIVADLAAKGSTNHRLLLELIGRGATLMGSESPELLVAEYRRIQTLLQMSKDATPESLEQLKREGDRLLRERDSYLANRIDITLNEGETGILFLGLLHRVDERLGEKFEVQQLIHSLPFGADPLWKWKERQDHGK